MTTPIFSVVMPVYNQAKYISQAIRSVLDQTFDLWELLIVDNHSTDGTVELIRSFIDPRIKIFSIENYGVIAKSRNLAIRSSTGAYIAFLDSDDTWVPSKLQEVSNVLRGKPELVYHWVNLISEDGSSSGKIESRNIKRPTFEDLIYNGNPIVNSSVVVSRKSLLDNGMLNESVELIGVEDYNMWLKLALTETTFSRIPKFLGAYRLHSHSISMKSTQIAVPVRAFKGLEDAISIRLSNRIHSRFWEIQGRTKIKSANFEDAVTAFSKALLNITGIRLVKLRLLKFITQFFILVKK
jgi:glycosyltransferase involved in cell wall biosynthesis